MSPPALRGSELPGPGPPGAATGVRPDPPAQGHPDRRAVTSRPLTRGADDATRGSPAAGTPPPPPPPRCPRAWRSRGGRGPRSPPPQPRPRHRSARPRGTGGLEGGRQRQRRRPPAAAAPSPSPAALPGGGDLSGLAAPPPSWRASSAAQPRGGRPGCCCCRCCCGADGAPPSRGCRGGAAEALRHRRGGAGATEETPPGLPNPAPRGRRGRGAQPGDTEPAPGPRPTASPTPAADTCPRRLAESPPPTSPRVAAAAPSAPRAAAYRAVHLAPGTASRVRPPRGRHHPVLRPSGARGAEEFALRGCLRSLAVPRGGCRKEHSVCMLKKERNLSELFVQNMRPSSSQTASAIASASADSISIRSLENNLQRSMAPQKRLQHERRCLLHVKESKHRGLPS
ncbi:basic salivary proline-rich protein 2-like [Anser cygnoides]|uniref:basic salivary proline-rich protein 2-like n=1 Tax=Anser cygnoides TaxID=8845 RepID=UPI0034D2C275